MIDKATVRLRNKRMIEDHRKGCIIMIGQTSEKSPGKHKETCGLSVRNHLQLTLV